MLVYRRVPYDLGNGTATMAPQPFHLRNHIRQPGQQQPATIDVFADICTEQQEAGPSAGENRKFISHMKLPWNLQ